MSAAASALTIAAFYDGIALHGTARTYAERIAAAQPELFAAPCEAVFDPARREEALRTIAERIGADADGMKMFVYLSHCALRTWENYRAKGIPQEIFFATMAFLTRFLAADSRRRGAPAFGWGWWFPRQLAMREFRLGALEYEMDGEEIAVHIPADADLRAPSVSASLTAARAFFGTYYPAETAQARMTCDSWMLSPALPSLLPPQSNIAAFARRFRVVTWERESTAFLEWIYPDPACPAERLPQTTSLQRAVRRHLHAGGKIGWAKGVLIEP